MGAYGAYETAGLPAALFTTMRSVYGASASHVNRSDVSTSCTVIFDFFVGAADVKEQALIRVGVDEVATVEDGDYFTLTGDSDRWKVFDVRTEPAHWECRCQRLKDRG